MKKAVLNCLIAALAVAAVFTSCKDDGEETKDDVGYLIAGKFASQTVSDDAVFYADYVLAKSAKSGLAETEKKLVGKIKDGDEDSKFETILTRR